MNLSMEIPTSLLPKVAHLCDIDFILAHLVLEDREYRDFFARSTRTKILDNGFHELGEPLPEQDIIAAARMVHPQFVVAPDRLGDMEWTLAAYRRMFARYNEEFCIAPVMQGESQAERAAFFHYAKRSKMVLWPFKKDRLNWIRELYDTPKWPSYTHLLGVKTFLELRVIRDILHKRTTLSYDTSKFVKFGLAKIMIDEYTQLRGRPLLDHSEGATDEQLMYIYHNIAAARKLTQL